MRILMLSWEYPPYLVGGMGAHVAELLPALARTTGLAESAFEVTYLIPELALQAYLAASIKTKPTKIKQLQRAYLRVMQQANKAN